MNTSKTSTTDIINILSELSSAPDNVLPEFRTFYDIGLPLCYLYKLGYIDELNDKAISNIRFTYSMLLAEGNLDDIGFKTLNEILEVFAPDEEVEDYVEEVVA